MRRASMKVKAIFEYAFVSVVEKYILSGVSFGYH